MNLAHATLDGSSLRLGSTTIPVPDDVMRDQNLAGRSDVVVGLRPEDLHGHGDGPVLPAKVDRVESVGASLLVHFDVDAEAPKTAGVAAATGGEVLEDVPITGRKGAPFIASFEPRSGVRTGDSVDVHVDTRRLHFFDPETETSTRGA
jgi:multiple sugar transport system ATP-binding protein